MHVACNYNTYAVGARLRAEEHWHSTAMSATDAEIA